MCHECVKIEELERDRSVMDKGAYLLNYKGCVACSSQTRLVVAEEQRVIADESEDVSYTHRCECGHEVAKHVYSFRCTETTHVYRMECGLCGLGEDEKEWA